MQIKEDAPVTSTANGGNGLDSPKLPIKPNSIFTRYKKLKKSNQRDVVDVEKLKNQ